MSTSMKPLRIGCVLKHRLQKKIKKKIIKTHEHCRKYASTAKYFTFWQETVLKSQRYCRQCLVMVKVDFFLLFWNRKEWKILTTMLCKSEFSRFLIFSATTVPRFTPFSLAASSVICIEKFYRSNSEIPLRLKWKHIAQNLPLKVIELMSYWESLPQTIQNLRKHLADVQDWPTCL